MSIDDVSTNGYSSVLLNTLMLTTYYINAKPINKNKINLNKNKKNEKTIAIKLVYFIFKWEIPFTHKSHN